MTPTQFPLDLSLFFDDLRITVMPFKLGEAMQSSSTKGGEILTSRTGNRLWSGEITVTPARHDAQDKIEVLVDTLRQPGASFFLYDPARRGPVWDPDGVGEDFNHTITDIGNGTGDMRILKVSNLPANVYAIADGDKVFSYLGRGDHLCIKLAGGRFSYHRIVTPTDAGPGGETDAFEVQPFVPDSASIGNTVLFVKPFLKAKIVPNSFSGGARKPALTDGFRFKWQQTLE